jgi:hypothetical protein
MNKNNIKKLMLQKEDLERKMKEVSVNLPFSDELTQYIGHIEQYHKDFEHLNIPIREKTLDNLPLGKFIHNKLRPRFRKWKSLEKTDNSNSFWDIIFGFTDLEIKIFEQLNSMGFSEMSKDPATDWEDGYIQLRKYFDEHNHCYVTPGTKTGSQNYPLGTWVTYQRTLRKNNKLDISKINRLNQLNFLWTVDLNAILLKQINNDPSLLETRVNLKKTFDLSINDEREVLINTYNKEQKKLSDVLEKLFQKKNEKWKLTYDAKELEETIKKIGSKLSAFDYISINESLDAKTQFERDKLHSLSTELANQISFINESIQSAQESIDKLEKDRSKLVSSVEISRECLKNEWKDWKEFMDKE